MLMYFFYLFHIFIYLRITGWIGLHTIIVGSFSLTKPQTHSCFTRPVLHCYWKSIKIQQKENSQSPLQMTTQKSSISISKLNSRFHSKNPITWLGWCNSRNTKAVHHTHFTDIIQRTKRLKNRKSFQQTQKGFQQNSITLYEKPYFIKARKQS